MRAWSWLALVALGAFHGINPAMGWLFAVALGLHRRSRAVVLESLIPIAVGHALAVGLVALAVATLGAVIDQRALRVVSGVALIGWAVYHKLYGSRHRVRVGMRVGMAGLAVWSFMMATAHGAGLMLVPFLLPLAADGSHAGHAAGHHMVSASLAGSVAAIAVHTARHARRDGDDRRRGLRVGGTRLPAPRLDQPRSAVVGRPGRHGLPPHRLDLSRCPKSEIR